MLPSRMSTYVCPELPRVVESERCLCDPDTSPSGKHEDPECVLRVNLVPRYTYEEKHGFGANGVLLLDNPEESNSQRLSCDPIDQETGY